jgi:hypothetical protein
MKFAQFFSTILVALLLASPAMAQDSQPVENEEFGVTVTPPAKWEVTPGNDKAVASFKHTGSQSQIEVVGTKLMTPDVADVFFKTFHKTLTESNFEQASQEETTIGEFSGTLTSYKFTHSGVTLEVAVFQFLRDSTAWLVVGYMQDTEKDEYIDDFKSVVQNMKFKAEAAE